MTARTTACSRAHEQTTPTVEQDINDSRRKIFSKSMIQKAQSHPQDWEHLTQNKLLCTEMPKPESTGVEDLELIRVSRAHGQGCVGLPLWSGAGGTRVYCEQADYPVTVTAAEVTQSLPGQRWFQSTESSRNDGRSCSNLYLSHSFNLYLSHSLISFVCV